MKRLWAPWRTKFVQTKTSGCVFCDLQMEPDGPDNLILFRGNRCFAILNRYPYTTGHLMIVANMHLNSFEDLDAGTRSDMMEMSTHAITVIRRVYQPDGFNVGANIGEAAGAGIIGHVHIHVVPRWAGDFELYADPRRDKGHARSSCRDLFPSPFRLEASIK